MMMFVDGVGYAADTESVTLPKLERKLEKWRGGGLNRPPISTLAVATI